MLLKFWKFRKVCLFVCAFMCGIFLKFFKFFLFFLQIVCILYELLNILNISNQIFYQRQILDKLKVYLNMNLVFYYKKDIWKVYNAPPKESGFFPCDKYILSVP